MKVAVLAGGRSPEREVSLRSGHRVATALGSIGHEAELIDLGVRRLDVAARLVVGEGLDVQLSEREAGLLRTLAGRPTRVFTRDELRDRVFGEAETDAVVETYVSYLRRKLDVHGPPLIHTVRGVGYALRETPP